MLNSIAERLQVVEAADEKGVFRLKDPHTGQEYYAKAADQAEIAATRAASAVDLGPNSVIKLPRILETGNNPVPALKGLGIAQEKLLITEALQAGDTTRQIREASGKTFSFNTDWPYNQMTDNEYRQFLQELTYLNNEGVSVGSPEDNIEFRVDQKEGLVASVRNFTEPDLNTDRFGNVDTMARAATDLSRGGALDAHHKQILNEYVNIAGESEKFVNASQRHQDAVHPAYRESDKGARAAQAAAIERAEIIKAKTQIETDQVIASRLQVDAEASTKDNTVLTDSETDKQYSARAVSPDEFEMSQRAANFDGKVLSYSRVIDAEANSIPTGSLNIPDGKKLLVTESTPAGDKMTEILHKPYDVDRPEMDWQYNKAIGDSQLGDFLSDVGRAHELGLGQITPDNTHFNIDPSGKLVATTTGALEDGKGNPHAYKDMLHFVENDLRSSGALSGDPSGVIREHYGYANEQYAKTMEQPNKIIPIEQGEGFVPARGGAERFGPREGVGMPQGPLGMRPSRSSDMEYVPPAQQQGERISESASKPAEAKPSRPEIKDVSGQAKFSEIEGYFGSEKTQNMMMFDNGLRNNSWGVSSNGGFYEFTSFNHPSGSPRGYKLHVSVDAADVSKTVDVLTSGPLADAGVTKFKVVNESRIGAFTDAGADQAGKTVTVYGNSHSPITEEAIRTIETTLAGNNVKPGVSPKLSDGNSEPKIKGSDYIYYRDDTATYRASQKGEVRNPEIEAVKQAASIANNPFKDVDVGDIPKVLQSQNVGANQPNKNIGIERIALREGAYLVTSEASPAADAAAKLEQLGRIAPLPGSDIRRVIQGMPEGVQELYRQAATTDSPEASRVSTPEASKVPETAIVDNSSSGKTTTNIAGTSNIEKAGKAMGPVNAGAGLNAVLNGDSPVEKAVGYGILAEGTGDIAESLKMGGKLASNMRWLGPAGGGFAGSMNMIYGETPVEKTEGAVETSIAVGSGVVMAGKGGALLAKAVPIAGATYTGYHAVKNAAGLGEAIGEQMNWNEQERLNQAPRINFDALDSSGGKLALSDCGQLLTNVGNSLKTKEYDRIISQNPELAAQLKDGHSPEELAKNPELAVFHEESLAEARKFAENSENLSAHIVERRQDLFEERNLLKQDSKVNFLRIHEELNPEERKAWFERNGERIKEGTDIKESLAVNETNMKQLSAAEKELEIYKKSQESGQDEVAKTASISTGIEQPEQKAEGPVDPSIKGVKVGETASAKGDEKTVADNNPTATKDDRKDVAESPTAPAKDTGADKKVASANGSSNQDNPSKDPADLQAALDNNPEAASAAKSLQTSNAQTKGEEKPNGTLPEENALIAHKAHSAEPGQIERA